MTSTFEHTPTHLHAQVAVNDDPYADIRSQIHHGVIEQLGARLSRTTATPAGDAGLDGDIARAIADCLDAVDRPLSRREREQILQDVRDDVLGYGPIDRYIRDDGVSEIMVNGASDVYVERGGRVEPTGTRFVDEAHVERIIGRIVSEVGRRVDESSPMVDARLPDGSRVNVILPPLALAGPCLTIRKFRNDPLTMSNLLELGTVTPRAGRFLELCVKGSANVLVSGGTGSGKTTFLNVLSAAIPESERIVTIEDAAELQLRQRHVVSLEARPANIEGQGEITIRDLVRNSLRMRPDRIVVGECRGPEAVDMLQAMNTGHEGSMTTIHANSARDAIARVETLVLTSGVELPTRAIREQIASSLHLVVHTARLVNGHRRVTRISEIAGLEAGVVTMQDIFVADADESPAATSPSATNLLSPLRPTGIVPTFAQHLAANGVRLPRALFDTTADGDDAPTLGSSSSARASQRMPAASATRRRFDTQPTTGTPTTTEETTMTHDSLRSLLHRDERGQTMAEYGVVLAVITVTIVGTLALLSSAINAALQNVVDVLG